MLKNKICTYCKKEKSLSEFGVDNGKKDKLSIYCIECVRTIALKNYYKNRLKILSQQKEQHKKFPWKSIWHDINKRCYNKNHSMYKYYGGKGIKNLFKSWDEIKTLWFRDKACEMKRPSIDRIDANENYCFNNCRFIELGLNTTNSHIISILQFNLEGKFIKEWESIQVASQNLNISRTSISSCLRGKIKNSKGFIWRYK
jgi:hypothetical protein